MSDLKTIWKNQEPEFTPMALEDIRTQAGKLHSNVRFRNIAEAAAAVLVIGAFGFYVWRFSDPLMRAGSVLIIIGTLYVMWRLFSHAGTKSLPRDAAAASWTDYYRGELVRQRDMLKRVWAWYLAPLAPGFVLFLAGMARTVPHAAIGKIEFTAVAGAVVFVSIGLLNSWGARRLQKKIDRLSD